MIYHTKNGVNINPGFLDEKFFRRATAVFLNKAKSASSLLPSRRSLLCYIEHSWYLVPVVEAGARSDLCGWCVFQRFCERARGRAKRKTQNYDLRAHKTETARNEIET